nr:melanopsin-like [Lytechinus pictus]
MATTDLVTWFPTVNSTEPSSVTEPVITHKAQRTFVACLFCLIGGVGLTGNSLVFIAVAMSRRLQTPTNVFVVSLSLSDFLTCLGLPFQAVAILSERGWPLAGGLCAMVGGSAMMSLTCGVVTLALIATNRFTLITRSKRTYTTLFSKKRNLIYVMISWLYPLLAFVVPQLVGFGRLGYDPYFKLCVWDTSDAHAHIYEILAAITIFIASTIITTSYVTIYIFIRLHVSVMKNHVDGNRGGQSVKINQVTMAANSLNNTNNNDASAMGTGTPGDRPRIKVTKREIDITKNLFYIVCFFFFCIIPYGFVLALTNLGVFPWYAGVMFVANSAVNPFIYASKHPVFKEVFRCMLTFRLSAIPEPLPWVQSLFRAVPEH